ncbi:MAG: hypothetical protein ACI4U9_02995 [Clostridia bacterium]
MGIINMVKNIKEIHPKDIILIKVGTFYYTYGKDAYIISYLFNYKLSKTSNICSCGFPTSNLNKVMAELEQKQINYIILDKRNNYDLDNKSDNKNLNKYDKFLEKAKEKINYDLRVQKIVDYLQANRGNKKVILEMEELIIERRKIQSN